MFLFGNAARGDDALGERLHDLLQLHFGQAQGQYEHVRLIGDFQLEPEHIFDLHDADIGIFVDASEDAASGVQWQSVSIGSQLHFSSHHLPPESLLFLYLSTFEQPPPPCYLLTMGAEQFELGTELSATAQHNLAAAFTVLQEKLAQLSLTPPSG